MRTLIDSKFITIDFDEFNKILKITWKAHTAEMNNNDFKAEMLAYAEFFNLGAKHVIHNMVEMQFTIIPELQVWLDQNINVRGIASGITTAAFVLSSDIFTSVSVQQTNEEANVQNIGVQYFDSEDEAIKWLLK